MGYRGQVTTREHNLWIHKRKSKREEKAEVLKARLESAIKPRPRTYPSDIARPMGFTPINHEGMVHSAFQVPGRTNQVFHPCHDLFATAEPADPSWVPNYRQIADNSSTFSHTISPPIRKYNYSDQIRLKYIRDRTNEKLK